MITGRGSEKIEAAIASISSSVRGRVRGVAADVGTAAGATTVVREVPYVDVLVNNLGIYEPKPFEEIADVDWTRLFEVNF